GALGWVKPLQGGLAEDAGQRLAAVGHLLDLLGRGRRQRGGQQRVVRTRGQQRQHLTHRLAEQRGQQRGVTAPVLGRHHGRVGDDVLGVGGIGQRHPVAVQDGAAGGVQRDELALLIGGGQR